MNNTNYKQVATRMIKTTAKSEAQVTTQWAGIVPLTAWVAEFPEITFPDPELMQRALDQALRRLTSKGLRSSLGPEFGGLKLQKSPGNTWLLYLYSQFDLELVEQAARQGVL